MPPYFSYASKPYIEIRERLCTDLHSQCYDLGTDSPTILHNIFRLFLRYIFQLENNRTSERVFEYVYKTSIISFQREIINHPLFSKETKVSTNNFKMALKGISGRLEMCNNIISIIHIYGPIRNFISHCTRRVRMVIP